jgi:hypothetical protein
MNPPEHFDFPDYAGVVHSASFLGPKQENGAMLPLQYLAALAVREGHAALKVYGHIEYIDDVSNKPHRTWFCYDYIVHKTAPSLVAGIDVFGACNEHNCEDDDCLESWDFMPRVAPMTTTAFDVDIPSPPTTPTATSTPPSVHKNRVRATQTSGTR